MKIVNPKTNERHESQYARILRNPIRNEILGVFALLTCGLTHACGMENDILVIDDMVNSLENAKLIGQCVDTYQNQDRDVPARTQQVLQVWRRRESTGYGEEEFIEFDWRIYDSLGDEGVMLHDKLDNVGLLLAGYDTRNTLSHVFVANRDFSTECRKYIGACTWKIPKTELRYGFVAMVYGSLQGSNDYTDYVSCQLHRKYK